MRFVIVFNYKVSILGHTLSNFLFRLFQLSKCQLNMSDCLGSARELKLKLHFGKENESCVTNLWSVYPLINTTHANPFNFSLRSRRTLISHEGAFHFADFASSCLVIELTHQVVEVDNLNYWILLRICCHFFQKWTAMRSHQF